MLFIISHTDLQPVSHGHWTHLIQYFVESNENMNTLNKDARSKVIFQILLFLYTKHGVVLPSFENLENKNEMT